MQRSAPGQFRRVRTVLAALLIFGLLLSLGFMPRDALAASFPSTELLVRFRSPSSTSAITRQWLAARAADQVRDDLRSYEFLPGSPSLSVFSFKHHRGAADAQRLLLSRPDVVSVDPNIQRELAWEPADAEYAEQEWWLTQVKAQDAWNITHGVEDVIVAVVDSGVSTTHPDLAGRLVPGYNAVDGTDNTADVVGHGTHVAGIIAAESNDVGTAGIAMGVRIMPVRVVDDAGKLSVADVIEGIYWAVDNGADVINLSIFSPEYVAAERDAIKYAYDRGVVVVTAAGNVVGDLSYPANYSETISVGALTADGSPAPFTSRVTRVDIAAPGESIFSPGWDPFYDYYWDNVFYSDFKPVSGTSFSAAIVSGAVALMKSVAPEYDTERVRQLLVNTAEDTGNPGPEAGTGAGQLDIEEAVRRAVYEPMDGVWRETDSPVAGGATSRTWLWGQGPIHPRYEPYAETQHGTRLVYYFDKSRMEVTNPAGDRANEWYVTNGLLVSELITGNLQLGDNQFEQRQPAEVNVAGDPDDTEGPVYASFRNLLTAPTTMADTPIILTIDRSGGVNADSALARYGVTGGPYVEETKHRVASVFWNYLNSTGLVMSGDTLTTGRLFDPWFYATGYPITEPYWSRVKVAGVVQDVLIQCFERRCLTYTPGNEPGWQVEMGNVGQHYYMWRYGTSVFADAGAGPALAIAEHQQAPLVRRGRIFFTE